MKLAVMIKQVPSSEARIKIGGDGTSVDAADLEHVVNPYDEYAMEAALRLKEKHGGEVTVVALGGNKIDEALRTCLALGADRAIALKDPAFEGSDAMATARILAAAVKTLSPDLVLCGKLSIDLENSATGIAVAELLDLPHVSVVSELEMPNETTAVVKREIEGGMETLEVRLPAVLTANKGLNEPRYASLKGIMMAKKKPLEAMDAAALGIDPTTVGRAASAVSVVAMEPPAERAGGQMFQGDPAEVVAKVVRLLREEAKVL